MTREEIIRKGEEMLQHTYNKTKLYNISQSEIISFAERGLAQLDMLYYILNEDFENYSKWFNIFYTLLCGGII